MNANVNAAKWFNLHTRKWNDPIGVDDTPPIMPEGPIEIYTPIADHTEDLDPNVNFEIEYWEDYRSLQEAIDSLPCYGRFMFSNPESDHYRGFLNHCPGSVAIVIY